MLAGLMAAVVHDVGHPGNNNNFQAAMSSELALTYNDRSVLENHHVAHAFRMLRAHPEMDIFANLTLDERKYVRKMMIEAVLATDMARHFEIVGKFKTKLSSNEPFDPNNIDDKMLAMQLAIKMADV